MLLPYVAPVVAATFAWTTMLNPQFGVVNYWGQKLLGWDEPIAFLSQVSGEVSCWADISVPTALLTVIAFEAWRSFPFAFLFLTARLQAVPATLEEAARVDGATLTQRFRLRRAAAAAADDRGAVGAALHLDVQQLRRHLPAHRRRRRHRGRQRAGVQRADRPR